MTIHILDDDHGQQDQVLYEHTGDLFCIVTEMVVIVELDPQSLKVWTIGGTDSIHGILKCTVLVHRICRWLDRK